MDRIYRIGRQFTQRAYRIRGIGLGRVCEAVRKTVAKNARGTVVLIDDFMGASKFYCELDEHMGSQIFWRGAYSGGQLRVLARHLRRDNVFLDVGANQGEFSIYAARLVGDNGRVVAFEPVSFNRAKLNRNIAVNGYHNITIVACALGNEESTLPIYSQPGAYSDGTQHTGLATLYESTQRGQLIEQVPVRKLDDICASLQLPSVDFIKLDVEGGEYAALQGAVSVIERWSPKLIFELGLDTCHAAGYEPSDMLTWLARLGYQFWAIDDDGSLHPVHESMPFGEFQNILALKKGVDG
jgi:FkbM family methyltransferase